MIKFYGYAKCSTCINAKKWLKSNNVPFEEIEITENPPSKKLLKSLLDSGPAQKDPARYAKSGR